MIDARWSTSPRVEALLDRVRSSASGWGRLFGQRTRERQALELITESREPGAALPLLAGLEYFPSDVHDAAAGAIRVLTSGLEPADLPDWDRHFRKAVPVLMGHRPGRSAREAPTRRAEFIERLAGDTRLLGLLASHGDGWMREAVVRKLDERAGDDAIPYLLLRLNDWVAEVRDAAAAALDRRLVPQSADAFARSFELVARLERQRRLDHRRIVEAVSQLLGAPESAATVTALFSSAQGRARTRLFHLLIAQSGPGRLDALERGLRDRQSGVRLAALRRIAVLGIVDDLRPAILAALRDRNGGVRAEVITLLARPGAPLANVSALLEAARFDPAALVRAQARFLLRERGFESPLDLYRDALRQGHLGRLRCSAEELSDHAGPEDAPLLRPLLDHADARVRWAALRGCLRLDPHVDEDRITRALDDDSSRVARVARSWLQRHASDSLRRAMSAILLESPRPMTRKRALRMLLHWGDRSSVSAVVEALDPQSPELQHEIVSSLSVLMLRRSVSNYPGVSVLPEVAQLIERRQALLGGALALRLRNFFWEPR